jgi:hypothetical protein
MFGSFRCGYDALKRIAVGQTQKAIHRIVRLRYALWVPLINWDEQFRMSRCAVLDSQAEPDLLG